MENEYEGLLGGDLKAGMSRLFLSVFGTIHLDYPDQFWSSDYGMEG